MVLFIALAAVFTLALLAYGLHPLWRTRAPALALAIAGLGMASVAALYWQYGRPEAIGYAAPTPEAEIDEALKQLEGVLAQRPDDLEARVLLARSYLQLGRFAEAQRHFADAVQRQPGNAALLVDYAESLFRGAGPDRPEPRAREWIERALAAEPGNQRALFFRGILLMQSGQAGEAAAAWEALLPQLDAATAQALLPQINMARQQAGMPALAAPLQRTVSITVDVEPGLRAQAPPGGVLFVFAKRTDGAGPPVAAKRVPVSAFPIRVQLSDADSIMPTAVLSSQPAFSVSARVSASGSAEAGLGDWQSAPVTMQSDKLAPVTLVLRRKP